ncbi:M56 family metallopeptidase [Bacteroides sp. ET489]|uniref:M56 family metallopeptidase n=1 Tax=Bacteroides sp. ET489 TaxID=3057126 RepID=UPI0026723435|nr:M56 family metallopeptidase [Bacteroides sp. ET489]MDO3389205.1 M56 family metallopeptidase [Bacteroides sp. ET489]
MVYFLKINVAIALFYAFYRLFFYKDTFFTWRRTALLCFFAVSAIVPLFNIQTWIEQQEPMAAMADLYATVVLPELTLTPQPETDWKQLLADGIGIVYWLVVALLTARFLVQLTGIIRLGRRCPTQKIDDTTVHLLPRPEGPFSFFRWIFVYPDAHTGEELHEILTHERTHARQWHSIDVMIGELACIVCWFNPFAWLMKREIRTNLEYMADEKVLETGHDSRTYQYHLLGLSHHKAAATIYNSFNVLPLKKRITMMNKRRTRAIGRTKYLMFLPLAALLMIVSNIEAVARATQKITAEVMEAVTPAETPEVQPQPENIVPSSQSEMNVAPIPQQEKDKKVTYKGKIVDDEAGNPISDVKIIIDHKYQSITKSTVNAQGEFRIETSPEASILFEYSGKDGKTLARMCRPAELAKMDPDNMVIELIPVNIIKSNVTDDDVYEVVENMPEFPNGGMGELMKYLSANIRYPEAAHKAGIQGRVTVQFVVGKDGSIGNVSILRGVNADLDAEAIRVISSMPKWKPGTQKGEPVKVKYTVPVMFRLAPEPVEKIDETTVVGYHTPVAGEVYDVVDKMPEFPGGMTGLMQYLSKNIRYPAEAQTKGVQGRVTVAVIINTEGKAVNASIIRSVDPSLDAEALRVASTMPDWVPGTKDGKPVNVKYTFPVTFRLQ